MNLMDTSTTSPYLFSRKRIGTIENLMLILGFKGIRVPHPLVPVRRFPRPSRSIHFGDVSLLRVDHVNRNELAERNNEA